MASQVGVSVPATRRAEFLAGFKATIPLALGSIPFAIIFGAVAVASGLSPAGAAGMSAFVFAGSAQFIATGLVASATPLPIIILTTFVVNLRHALYAASLAPYMKHLPQRWLAPLGFSLTDQSFVLVIQRYEEPDSSPYKHWYFLGSSVLMYFNWQLWTWFGIVAGQRIPNPAQWGLDFAMSVTFIGMLVPMVKNRPVLVSVVVGGVVALLAHGLPNQLGLLVAALTGVVAGLAAENVLSKREPTPQPRVADPHATVLTFGKSDAATRARPKDVS